MDVSPVHRQESFLRCLNTIHRSKPVRGLESSLRRSAKSSNTRHEYGVHSDSESSDDIRARRRNQRRGDSGCNQRDNGKLKRSAINVSGNPSPMPRRGSCSSYVDDSEPPVMCDIFQQKVNIVSSEVGSNTLNDDTVAPSKRKIEARDPSVAAVEQTRSFISLSRTSGLHKRQSEVEVESEAMAPKQITPPSVIRKARRQSDGMEEEAGIDARYTPEAVVEPTGTSKRSVRRFRLNKRHSMMDLESEAMEPKQSSSPSVARESRRHSDGMELEIANIHRKQPHRMQNQKQKTGFRLDYVLGESARSNSHMVIEENASRALNQVCLLKDYDFAFVKRKDGVTWSYAILAYRSFTPARGADVHECADEGMFYSCEGGANNGLVLEECMVFVVGNDGETKMIRKQKWGEYIRHVSMVGVDDGLTVGKPPVLPKSPQRHGNHLRRSSFHGGVSMDKKHPDERDAENRVPQNIRISRDDISLVSYLS